MVGAFLLFESSLSTNLNIAKSASFTNISNLEVLFQLPGQHMFITHF